MTDRTKAERPAEWRGVCVRVKHSYATTKHTDARFFAASFTLDGENYAVLREELKGGSEKSVKQVADLPFRDQSHFGTSLPSSLECAVLVFRPQHCRDRWGQVPEAPRNKGRAFMSRSTMVVLGQRHRVEKLFTDEPILSTYSMTHGDLCTDSRFAITLSIIPQMGDDKGTTMSVPPRSSVATCCADSSNLIINYGNQS